MSNNSNILGTRAAALGGKKFTVSGSQERLYMREAWAFEE